MNIDLSLSSLALFQSSLNSLVLSILSNALEKSMSKNPNLLFCSLVSFLKIYTTLVILLRVDSPSWNPFWYSYFWTRVEFMSFSSYSIAFSINFVLNVSIDIDLISLSYGYEEFVFDSGTNLLLLRYEGKSVSLIIFWIYGRNLLRMHSCSYNLL